MNKQILSIFIKDTFDGKITPTENKKLQETQPRIYKAIFDYTDYLPPSSSFTERCYLLENQIENRPTCACGKLLKFKNYQDGFGDKCSTTCKG